MMIAVVLTFGGGVGGGAMTNVGVVVTVGEVVGRVVGLTVGTVGDTVGETVGDTVGDVVGLVVVCGSWQQQFSSYEPQHIPGGKHIVVGTLQLQPVDRHVPPAAWHILLNMQYVPDWHWGGDGGGGCVIVIVTDLESVAVNCSFDTQPILKVNV
jgi:hypothetical protein